MAPITVVTPPRLDTIFGVDFSGARLAGRFVWVARLRRTRGPVRYRLSALDRLDQLAGAAERGPALAHLVRLVADSDSALWGLDFPFAFPAAVMKPGATWDDQFAFVRSFEDAYPAGVECVRRSLARGGPMHVRRATDAEAKAPLDPYHYRIIYQTFHGLRDVLDPLRRLPRTAVLPFQYRKFWSASRVLVESCPACVLKRFGLPHARYKQPRGGPLERVSIRNRHAILDGIARYVVVEPTHRRVVMRDSGADALDAVLAAVRLATAWPATDHKAIARHPHYPREGRLYG